MNPDLNVYFQNLEIEKIDLTKCRLCQQNTANIEISSNDELCQQILICTRINIKDDISNKKLPKYICNLCKNIIDQFIHFQDNCLKINEKLKLLLEKSKTYPYLIVTTEIIPDNEKIVKRTKYNSDKKYLIKNSKNKIVLKSVCKKCNQPKRGRHRCRTNRKSIKLNFKKSEIKVENDSVSRSVKLSENNIKKDDTEPEKIQFDFNKTKIIKNDNFDNEIDDKDNIQDYDIVYYDHDYDSEKHLQNENAEKANNEEQNKTTFNENKQYICDYSDCRKKFSSKLGYKKHIERHEIDKVDINLEDVSDDENKIKFKRLRKSKESEKNDYVCKFADCAKSFISKAVYRQHVYNMHDIKEFLCPSCGKVFRRHSALKVHERIHLPTKQFVCTICDMGFSQQANLKTHVKLHHEGHRFYCTKCGKGFLTNVTLKRHELIHIGVKDFKCDICPSAFYTRRELIKHKRYHYGIRPHFCTICYRTYVEKHHLTIHMRAHTGERPYVCDVNSCGKGFAESQKLRRHKKNVHRIKVE